MQQTLEVERRNRRDDDTGLASTYQLDTVRRERGFRAIVVASGDGEMLLGSMDEPLGKPLARATGAVGVDAPDADVWLLDLRDDHLDGDRSWELHVLEIMLENVPVYLGILARRGQPLGDAFERTVTGLERIFQTT